MSPRVAAKESTAAFDVAIGLAAALAWGAASLVLGQTRASPLGIVESLGSAAGLAVPLVALLRLARPWPEPLRALVLGALLVAAPLAVLGTLLVEKTHHRALGGVTFAALALVVTLVAWPLARRLLASDRAAPGRAAGAVASVLGSRGLLAVGAATLLVLGAVLSSGPAASRAAAVGLVSVVLALLAPARQAPRALGLAAGLLAAALAAGAAIVDPGVGPP
jgi:hypothetical protein